jgi:hypothetical protein
MATMVVAVLFVQASHAQPIPGQSPKEKARQAEKKAEDKDVDRDYKSSLKQIPDASKNPDPWGNLRSPNAPSSTGAK